MDKQAIYSKIVAIESLLADIKRELFAQPTQCEHRNIKNLTTMGGLEEWRCLDCGLHYKGE